MADQWFYRLRAKQYGPVSFERLKELCEHGVIEPETDVRKGSIAEWISAEAIPELCMAKKMETAFVATPLLDEPVFRSPPSQSDKQAHDALPTFRKPILIWIIVVAVLGAVALFADLRIGNPWLFVIALGIVAIFLMTRLPPFRNIADFFAFRLLIVPHLISIIFILACFGFVLLGATFSDRHGELNFAIMIAGVIISRLVCEYLVVHFRINNTLTEIKNKMDEIRSQKPPE